MDYLGRDLEEEEEVVLTRRKLGRISGQGEHHRHSWDFSVLHDS